MAKSKKKTSTRTPASDQISVWVKFGLTKVEHDRLLTASILADVHIDHLLRDSALMVAKKIYQQCNVVWRDLQ